MAVAKFQAVASRSETAKSRAAPPPGGSAIPREKIAERAYQIWLASGRRDGHDQEHWFQAEGELRSARPASRAASR